MTNTGVVCCPALHGGNRFASHTQRQYFTLFLMAAVSCKEFNVVVLGEKKYSANEKLPSLNCYVAPFFGLPAMLFITSDVERGDIIAPISVFVYDYLFVCLLVGRIANNSMRCVTGNKWYDFVRVNETRVAFTIDFHFFFFFMGYNLGRVSLSCSQVQLEDSAFNYRMIGFSGNGNTDLEYLRSNIVCTIEVLTPSFILIHIILFHFFPFLFHLYSASFVPSLQSNVLPLT